MTPLAVLVLSGVSHPEWPWKPAGMVRGWSWLGADVLRLVSFIRTITVQQPEIQQQCVWSCSGWFCLVSGLAELASRKYKPAAKCFLQASFDHCDCPEVSWHPNTRHTFMHLYAPTKNHSFRNWPQFGWNSWRFTMKMKQQCRSELSKFKHEAFSF